MQHTIKKGECLAVLAKTHRMSVDKIWNDGKNADLKKLREHPHLVMEGDTVEVPEAETKEVNTPHTKKHKFRISSFPAHLRIKIIRFGEPVKNAEFELTCGDEAISGKTDGEGVRDEKILATETTGHVKIKFDDGDDEFDVEIGDLAPAGEVVGLQARLANLGYEPGAVDGALGPLTKRALVIFQEDYELEATGEPDQPTEDKLVELHGI